MTITITLELDQGGARVELEDAAGPGSSQTSLMLLVAKQRTSDRSGAPRLAEPSCAETPGGYHNPFAHLRRLPRGSQ